MIVMNEKNTLKIFVGIVLLLIVEAIVLIVFYNNRMKQALTVNEDTVSVMSERVSYDFDMEYSSEEIMELAARQAEITMAEGIGGPFGAAIVKDNKIIAVASNSVLGDNDPTAHAEVNAIRAACRKLGTHDLSGCEIYATGSPCPMCMSAIIWANMKKVYRSGYPEDADNIGFRDAYIYDFIENKCKDESIVEMEDINRDIAANLYNEYKEQNKTIY